MNKTYLRKILLSRNSQLLITAEGLASIMMEAFPVIPSSGNTPVSFFFNEDPPTYKENVNKALNAIQKKLKATAELQNINLTTEFDSPELPEGSIAYHRIWGIITAASKWYFSSKQFETDLLSAEDNPSIACHFIHANSPGGEAWYMDRLSQTMRSLQKPVITLYEQSNCSACYYITCHSNYIAALTNNDFVGCIGTMIDTYDFDGYFDKLGIKHIQARSHQSDLKNKKFDDLKNDKPDHYITDVLDPLTTQFIAEVRSCRKRMTGTKDEDPVLRGEVYYTQEGIDKGLVDGCMTFIEAVAKAAEMGTSYIKTQEQKKNALNYL